MHYKSKRVEKLSKHQLKQIYLMQLKNQKGIKKENSFRHLFHRLIKTSIGQDFFPHLHLRTSVIDKSPIFHQLPVLFCFSSFGEALVTLTSW